MLLEYGRYYVKITLSHQAKRIYTHWWWSSHQCNVFYMQ